MPDKLPRFPNFRPISVEDALLFNAIFAEEQPVISEFTFTNLFVWRNKYNFQVCECGGGVFVFASPDGEEPFFMPPIGSTDPAAAAQKMLDHMSPQGLTPRICRVPIAGNCRPRGATSAIASLQSTGIYQAINQEFCKTITGQYKYVNREQDIGDPGLKQANTDCVRSGPQTPPTVGANPAQLV